MSTIDIVDLIALLGFFAFLAFVARVALRSLTPHPALAEIPRLRAELTELRAEIDALRQEQASANCDGERRAPPAANEGKQA